MPGPRVYILDAAPQDYQVLADILQGGGYAVDPQESTAVAEAAAPANAPDLILLNIQTAFGLQRFRELKSQSHLKQVPILFILEKYDADFAARCLEIGAEDFILKPFHPPEILARVAVALKIRERELRLGVGPRSLPPSF